MPRRPRGLTEADQALWTNYASQLAPLRARRPKSAAAPAAATPPPSPNPPNPSSPNPSSPKRPPRVAKADAAIPAPPPPKSRRRTTELSVGEQPGGIDSATWHRFRSGKLTAIRTLDLHGMTANRAHTALVAFIRTAHAEQVRCVEVVTGRGSGDTGGVIRREFPHWLNLPEIRPLILGAAHPHALNPGSVRLILRRIR